MEIEHYEMLRLSEIVYKNHCRKQIIAENKKLWAIKGVSALVKRLIAKKH